MLRSAWGLVLLLYASAVAGAEAEVAAAEVPQSRVKRCKLF
jgi:hypothetical protein